MTEEEFNENKRFHLKLIEDVITRMNHNSFLIRGWSLTLISGLFAISLKEYINKEHFISILLIIFIIFLFLLFWVNDAYYLLKERDYRKLYSSVAKENKKIDFNMKPSSIDNNCFVSRLLESMFRPIFLLSYLPLLCVSILTLTWIH